MSPADRELLELAAKAARLTLEWQDSKGADSPLPWCVEQARYWDPREDDGDTFRLQVDLGMTVTSSWHTVVAQVERLGIACEEMLKGPDRNEARAAARRAVVRAAAAVGKEMP